MFKKIFFLILFVALSAGAVEILPGEPSSDEIKKQLPLLSGYDGFALYCIGEDIYSVLATKEGKKYFIRKTKIEGVPCVLDSSKKFVLEPLHD